MKSKNVREVLLFIILTYLLTWSIWGMGYYFYTVSHSSFLLSITIFIGSCMPSLMGIIITLCFYKTKGLREFLGRLSILRNHGIYCVAGVAAIIIYIFSTFSLAKILGINERFKIDFITIVSNFIIILFLGGPIGEEMGWRGFLLERVHSRFNVCISSIIVGTIWALWHTPLFFIPGSSQYDCPLTVYILNTIIITIIMTIVFDRTNKCITYAMILHATSNTLVTSIAGSSSISNYFLFLKENQIIYIKLLISFIILLTLIEMSFSFFRNRIQNSI